VKPNTKEREEEIKSVNNLTASKLSGIESPVSRVDVDRCEWRESLRIRD
jgi:hypothetical protein